VPLQQADQIARQPLAVRARRIADFTVQERPVAQQRALPRRVVVSRASTSM
jgi:hypothetical protein